MIAEDLEENMQPDFGAALFAFEGIIIDVFSMQLKAWRKLCEESGVAFKEEWEQAVSEGEQEKLLEFIFENQNTSPSEEDKKQMIERKNQYYEQAIQGAAPKDVRPGIGPLLKHLKKNGVKIALVSLQKNAADVIDQLDIGDFFDEIVSTVDMDSEKPAAEFFMTAADRLGERYKHCVVIESIDSELAIVDETKMPAVVVGGKDDKVAWAVDNTSEITYEGLKELFS